MADESSIRVCVYAFLKTILTCEILRNEREKHKERKRFHLMCLTLFLISVLFHAVLMLTLISELGVVFKPNQSNNFDELQATQTMPVNPSNLEANTCSKREGGKT